MPSPRPAAAVFNAALERARTQFRHLPDATGFIWTKKKLWVRQHQHTADWFTFTRMRSLGNSVHLRMQSGIRVLNSASNFLSAYGPDSHEDFKIRPELRLHLRFNVVTDSMYERSIEDAGRFFQSVLEPWFQRFQDVSILLSSPDPDHTQPTGLELALHPSDKQALAHAIAHGPSAERVDVSLRLLGIKPTK